MKDLKTPRQNGNLDTLGLLLPSRKINGQPLKDGDNPGVQRDIVLYNFLTTAADKLIKLESGESDPKIKARLYEIATRNLQNHSKYGGKPTDYIEFEKSDGTTLRFTSEAISKQLEKFRQ